MKYKVSVSFEGQTINNIGDLSRREAISTAISEAGNKDMQVFITWFRTSDGQKGYLNSDGNHEITGKAW